MNLDMDLNSAQIFFLAIACWVGALIFAGTSDNALGWELLLLALMVSMFVLYGLRRLEEAKPKL